MPYEYIEKIGKMAKQKRLERIAESEQHAFESDPRGFFVIRIDAERGLIVLEHYKERYEHKALVSGSADLIIEGKSAERLCHTIVQRGLVSRLEHACYLGRELQKAEAALREGKKYAQDE